MNIKKTSLLILSAIALTGCNVTPSASVGESNSASDTVSDIVSDTVSDSVSNSVSDSVSTPSSSLTPDQIIEKLVTELQQTITFKGSLTKTVRENFAANPMENETTVTKTTLVTKCTEDMYFGEELNEDGSISFVNTIYKGEDGLSYYDVIDKHNTITTSKYQLSGADVEFDAKDSYLVNPFNFFDNDSFTAVSGNKVGIDPITESSEEVGTDSILFITLAGYGVAAGQFESIELSFNDDYIPTGLSIKTKEIYSDYTMTYTSFVLDVSIEDLGSTTIDKISTYETHDYDESVNNAFKKLQDNNYTIHYVDTYSTSDNSTITDVIEYQVTDKAIYSDNSKMKNPSYGIDSVYQSDKGVSVYSYDKDTEKLTEDYFFEGQTIDDHFPTFDFSGALLSKNEDGSYSPVFETYKAVMSEMVAFNDGNIYSSIFSSIKIRFDDSFTNLLSIDYDYSQFGTNGHISYTFSNIGSTVIDIDFSKMKSGDNDWSDDALASFVEHFGEDFVMPYISSGSENGWNISSHYNSNGEDDGVSISTYYEDKDYNPLPDVAASKKTEFIDEFKKYSNWTDNSTAYVPYEHYDDNGQFVTDYTPAQEFTFGTAVSALIYTTINEYVAKIQIDLVPSSTVNHTGA
ncbi:MAG: hypothetical protein WCR67_01830 [Bacilli bacterium]